MRLSPDASLLLVENDIVQQADPSREQLPVNGVLKDIPPRREGVQLTILRTADRTEVAKSEARIPVELPVIDGGYLETLSGKKDHWIVRHVPFHGEGTIIADIPSACQPNESLLNSQTALVITCMSGSSDHLALATSMDGKRLWNYRWEGRYIWPTLASSEDGSRIAFSTLRVTHPLSASDPFDDTDVSGQRVQVLDSASGSLRLVEFAAPIESAGQNYALIAGRPRVRHRA